MSTTVELQLHETVSLYKDKILFFVVINCSLITHQQYQYISKTASETVV